MRTKTVPFDIYIPATESREAVKVTTIDIEVATDASGNEMITAESSALIDKTQARYMGLLAGEDIRALRERLGFSQDQFSDLIGCGKKSLSRWENGHEFPSQLVNTLLRLLDEERVSHEDLRAVRQPRISECDKITHFIGSRRNAPRIYKLGRIWKNPGPNAPEPIAM